VRSYTRHQLKENAFAETTADTISWAVEHRSKLTAAAIAVAVVAAVVLGSWAYVNYRNQQASQELAGALQKYQAPIRAAGEPASPETLSYASAAERAKAANPLFVDIASRYRWWKIGANAQYFAGLTYLDLGQTASAEAALQKASSSHDSALAALAKMALAGLYRQTERNGQAVDLYQQLIKNPTNTVPASAAKLQLAQLYETTNPAQAKKLYAEIKDQDKNTAASQIATQKLSGGKQPLQ